jgi:hypothetical protein
MYIPKSSVFSIMDSIPGQRTRNFRALLASVLLLSSLSSIAFADYASSQSASSCTSQLRKNLNAAESAIDTAKAIALAYSSASYQSMSKGYTSTFDSIFNIWSYNANCAADWKTLNVVFARSSNQEGPVTKLVVTEDPRSTMVYNVTLQEELTSAYTTSNYCCWSSYEFTGNSGGTNPVYEATASWTVPTANVPSQGCSFVHCDLAIWPGLENQQGGGSGTSR